ncbi:MAG: preprotein translocase subunit YajC [Planctomycetota bacterium]|jgi:preprotein translocase subunit YajC
MNALISLALLFQGTDLPSVPLEGDGADSGLGSMFIPIIIVMALFYVIMLGPEKKQRKKREAMLASMKKGQKVMTTGGMYGVIGAVSDDVITLIVSEGVRVRFSRSAIQTVIDDEKNAKADQKAEEPKLIETAKA